MAERIVERPVASGAAGSEHWAQLIGRWHRGWRVDPPPPIRTRHELRAYALDDLVVVNCQAPPCRGSRRADREADAHDGGELAILILHQGREEIDTGTRTFCLGAGQAFVWDTRADGHFRVDGALDKSTLFLPRETLAAWFPEPDGLIGREPIAADQTLALRALIRALDKTPEPALAGQSSVALASALRELTYVTLASALRSHRPERRSSALWAGALKTIEERLPEPVTAEDLALALGISVRSVYQLFADRGTTVRRFVKQRRLVRSRLELADPRAAPGVAATALRWGFADQSAFTRAFREQFGQTPGALARQRRRAPW